MAVLSTFNINLSTNSPQVTTGYYNTTIKSRNLIRITGYPGLVDVHNFQVTEPGYYELKTTNINMSANNRTTTDPESGENIMHPAVTIWSDTASASTFTQLSGTDKRIVICDGLKAIEGVEKKDTSNNIGQGIATYGTFTPDLTTFLPRGTSTGKLITPSSAEFIINDYHVDELSPFVYLQSGVNYQIVGTEISHNHSNLFVDDISASGTLSTQYSAFTAHGTYDVTIVKTNVTTSLTSDEGIYFETDAGLEAISDLNYFTSLSGLYPENAMPPNVVNRPVYFTNVDTYGTSAIEDLYYCYFNSWPIETNLQSDQQYGQFTPTFWIHAPNASFGRWTVLHGQRNPTTSDCDIVLVRKSDRQAVRLQGDLTNTATLCCTNARSTANYPELQRLRYLGII